VAWLRLLIVDGELRPGDRMNQEELAERAGVSLAPVREALRVLEQEGQVTYRPGRGYFVTALSIADPSEIYDLRRMIEERAARAALAEVDSEAARRRCACRPGRESSLPVRNPDHADAASYDACPPHSVGVHRGLPGYLLQLAGGAPGDD
jgi:DNA-binding GntR family transcriptional regulator